MFISLSLVPNIIGKLCWIASLSLTHIPSSSTALHFHFTTMIPFPELKCKSWINRTSVVFVFVKQLLIPPGKQKEKNNDNNERQPLLFKGYFLDQIFSVLIFPLGLLVICMKIFFSKLYELYHIYCFSPNP